MTTQLTRLEVRANMKLTDEQIHAISHAQKVLRGVKLYDLAELLSASKPAAPHIDTTDCEDCGTLGVSVGANCPRCGRPIAARPASGDK